MVSTRIIKTLLNIRSKRNLIVMTESEFVRLSEANGVGIKSALMEYAALSRGYKVKRLSNKDIIVAIHSEKKLAFSNMNGVSSSVIGKTICDNKNYTLKLLKNSVSTSKSRAFEKKDLSKAIRFLDSISFPAVVKPNSLSRGRGVTIDINTVESFKEAWEKAFSAYKSKSTSQKILIEKYFPGESFRFFVVGNKVISVTHRKEAFISGDGISTVKELIQIKNKERTKNSNLSNYLIPTKLEELYCLSKRDLSLEYIPGENEEVQLLSICNLSAGGDSIDYTDKTHKGFKEIAILAVQLIPGMKYAGVDIIAENITNAPNFNNYIVNEIEYSPGPMSHFPVSGLRRDMAGAIFDYYIKQKWF